MRRCCLLALGLSLLTGLSTMAQRPPGGGGGKPPGPRGPSQSNRTMSLPRPMNTGPVPEHPNANQESKVEFHSETVLVQVPVVVVGKRGDPVHGLSKDDFEVFENNKPQKIAMFEEFTSSHQRLLPETTASNTFTNGFGRADQSHSVTVLLLDTINTPFLDQAYGRKELIRYLATNLDPGQIFALVVLGSKGMRVLQGFTQDSAALIEALKKLNGELPVMQGVDIETQARAATTSIGDVPVGSSAIAGSVDPYTALQDFVLNGDADIARVQQDHAIESTMRGFLDVSWALSGVPGRKSLVWATGSFPFYIDSPGAVPGGYLSVLYERAMKAMNDAQISVYPVDVRGLVNTSPAADVSVHLRYGPAATQQAYARTWLQGSTIDTLRDFADMTGGRAFYNTNDLATSFHRAAADSASYYLVAYYLDTANRDPGWRKLKVKVKRNDVQVRSRNGFFVTNATINPELSRKLDLGFAVNSPLDSTGVPLSVQWTGIAAVSDPKSEAKTDRKRVNFLIKVGGAGVSVDSADNNRVNLDLLAFAFTGKGKETAADLSQTFALSIPDDQLSRLREQGLGYRNALDLPPGRYTVRFVVRDNVSGRVGSVSAPVTVN